MVAKVVGLTHIVGSYLMTITLGDLLAFRKGQVETDGPHPRLTPLQVWRRVKHFLKVTKNGVTRIDEYGE